MFTFSPIESLKLSRNIGTHGLDVQRGVADDTDKTSILERSRTLIMPRAKLRKLVHERAEAARKADAAKNTERPIEVEQTITMHLPSSHTKGDDRRS